MINSCIFGRHKREPSSVCQRGGRAPIEADRKTPRRLPAGVSMNQAAIACSLGHWIAAMMSAATCWIRSRDAASVSVLPS